MTRTTEHSGNDRGIVESASSLLALATHDRSPRVHFANEQLTIVLSYGKHKETDSTFPVFSIALKGPQADDSEQAVLCIELPGDEAVFTTFLKKIDHEVEKLSTVHEGVDKPASVKAQIFLRQLELYALEEELPVACYDPIHGNTPINLSDVTFDPTLNDSPTHRLVHGLPTRVALESQEFMSEINQQIIGKKVFCVFDFKHMRVANGLGLEAGVDELLGCLKDIAKKTLGDSAMLLSLGGDEFGIMISQIPGLTEPLLRGFFTAIAEKREEILNRDAERHLAARQMAAVRSAARSIFVDIQQDIDPVSAGFANSMGSSEFTVERCMEIARARLDNHNVAYHDSDDAGALTLKLARVGIDRGNYPSEVDILGLSKGFCRAGSEPDPERMKLVYSIAAKGMDKGQGDAIPDLSTVPTPQDLRANRRSDKRSLELTALAEEQYTNALETLSIIKKGQVQFGSLTAFVSASSALVHAQARAPDVGQGVLLASLVKDRALQHFGMHQEAECFASIIDIPGFSAINNNEGPDRADGFMNINAKILRENFPDAFICRKNGKLLLFTRAEPQAAKLENIQKDMSASLKSGLFKQAAEVEYLINEHISRLLDPDSAKSKAPIPPFGEITISKPTSVSIARNMLGQDLFDQVVGF